MAAINKRKLLESAQRHLQKGAVDKALADYQVVLQADPRDTNVRLKVGDLLQKAGRNDDAIAAYLKVADQFQRDGFDAKAVALYKQVTKIDGKRHDVYVPLADLYQRLGLVSEAMGALQTAAEAYQRDGRKREALDLLRRMASLDPANVTSRLKVAELLKQEGLVDEAVAEFREAAAELERQGDWEARAGVLERVVELRPEGVEDLEGLAATWLDRGQPRRAHAFAQKLVEADPTRPDSHEILARVLSDLGQEELAIDAFRQCAEAWRVRGEDARAREIVQRYLPAQDFESLASSSPEATSTQGTPAAADLFGSAGELGAEPAAGEGVFGSEPIEIGADRVVELGGDAPAFEGDEPFLDETPAPAAAPKAAPAAAPKPAPAKPAARAPEPAPEGDVEQLLAEAAVYTRYGKHERALACLEAAIAQDGAHGGALEQLGEVQLAAGAPERAVEAWTRAAELAGEARDAARFAVLRARIETVDPVAAGALHAPVPAGAPAPTVLFEVSHPELDDEAFAADDGGGAAAPDEADELEDIEIDVDDVSLDDADEPETPEAAAGAEGAVELDLELDEEAPAEEAGQAAAEPALSLDEGEPAGEEPAPPPMAEAAADPSLADEDEIVFDGEDAAAPVEDDEPPAPRTEAWELPDDDALAVTEPPASPAAEPAAPAAAQAAGDPHAVTPAPGELSMSAAEQIQEDFEEAGFYFDQGLLAEAEAVYRRILARAPSHPGALLRLGEIAVQRGTPMAVETPAPAPPVAAAPPATTPPAVEEAPEIEPPDALDLTAPTLDDAEDAAWSGEVAPPPEADDSTSGVTADLAGQSFDDTTLRPGSAPLAEATAPPASPAAAPEPAVVPAPAATDVAAEPELTAPDLAAEDGAAGPAFDLAAELSEALSDTGSGTTGRGTDEDGFASLFRDFKRGVSQTLGEGDVETHFDLGIAYKEMGLFEDAIGEFRYALGTPARRLDALQLMGLCAIDLGRGQDAVGHLEQALASPDVPAEREAPLRYELGRAYLVLPDRVRALDAFRRAYELDPAYQDLAERIAELERGDDAPAEAPAPEAAAEAFESFDDLVAEAADDAPPAAPSYESFDDVVAEANDDEDPDDDDDVPEAAADGPAVADADLALAAVEDETESALADATVEDDDSTSGAAPAPVVAEPEPEPQPQETASPAQRRRRKVSFV